jgi:hypothetical protein
MLPLNSHPAPHDHRVDLGKEPNGASSIARLKSTYRRTYGRVNDAARACRPLNGAFHVSELVGPPLRE